MEVQHNGESVLYGPVTPDQVTPLLDAHFGAERTEGAALPVVSRHRDHRDYPFLGRQVKLTTQLCGRIDPHSLDDYLAHDGYAALRQAITMPPAAVIQLVKEARLRGRGRRRLPDRHQVGDQPPPIGPA